MGRAARQRIVVTQSKTPPLDRIRTPAGGRLGAASLMA
jgi:hypothetical protein